jgi:crossover junction endodeoxyribonuclease RuvC
MQYLFIKIHKIIQYEATRRKLTNGDNTAIIIVSALAGEKRKHMIILGIDPGLALMGYGIIETNGHQHKLLGYGVIETKAHTPTPQRLRALQLGVRDLITIYKPDDIAFEELFFARNVTTGLTVGAARGAAIIAAAEYTENLYEYTPMQIKQAVVGYGRAEKAQVQQMVKMLLNMKELPKPDDAADGIAVAITHAHTAHSKELFRMK